MLHDNETKTDLLSYEPIAGTIAALLTEPPFAPMTIGIHGDWGAGKSSVLEMVEHALSSQKDFLSIKFNGWRYQGFEDAKISLLEDPRAGGAGTGHPSTWNAMWLGGSRRTNRPRDQATTRSER